MRIGVVYAWQHLLRDRDRIYGTIVTRRLRAMGIRDKPTASASPWQNGFAERLIGSIRRECVDHFVVLGEAHLRRILRAYARYYNDIRTHRSLDKDALACRPLQRTGIISSHADPWRTSSPLRPGVGFRYTQRRATPLSIRQALQSANHRHAAGSPFKGSSRCLGPRLVTSPGHDIGADDKKKSRYILAEAEVAPLPNRCRELVHVA